MPNVSDYSAPAIQTSSSKNTASKAATSGAGDFQTFLTLLTAQMRNQDPLKPMDSTEFVAQLASFSAVEQQVQTNDQLAQMMNLLSGSPASSMAEWIGKEVRHYGEASYNDHAIDIGPAVHPYADAAILKVRDTDGQLIYETAFGPNQETLEWNGETTEGSVAATGRYTFEVESYLEGNLIAAEMAPVFDLVTEVRMENGSPLLVFADGTMMLADQATSMRLPET